MALVVLLRGVNVGGHRTFRPAALAAGLQHLGTVNIGAAGTFVVHEPITQAKLRAELARRLPFETEIMICEGRAITRLMADDPFAGDAEMPDSGDVVRFVSVLARRPAGAPPAPMRFPADGDWQMKIVRQTDRFVIGAYRRQMKAVAWLATLDRLYGVPATTRNWNTMTAIARALGPDGRR